VDRLKPIVLERLIRYYRFLAERVAKRPTETVTSAQLGHALGVDASQVRKDFGAIGLAGVSRVGYDTCEVCRTIRTVLGFDEEYEAVLVGAGNLGGALLAYTGFARYGLRVVAAFDSDPTKVGQRIAGYVIQPVAQLRPFIEQHRIEVAMLTTPVDAAQRLAELVTLAGVKAIWNFTPTHLDVPDHVLTRNEHISVGLAEIAYHLRSPDGASPDDPSGEPTDACCGNSGAGSAAAD